MKTKFIFSLALLFALSFAFTGCKKDKDDPSNDNTLGTQIEAGGNVFFRCKIDGADFEAALVQAFQTNGAGTAQSLWQYQVYAEASNGAYFQASIQNLKFNRVTAQTYDMEAPSQDYSVSVIYSESSGSTIQAIGGAQIPGEFKISSISGTNTSGTFNFTLQGQGVTKVVTEGTYGTDKYADDV